MNPTIFFAGGGTLGSVTPLIAVAEELRQRHPAWGIIFIGTNEGPEESLITAAGFEFKTIPSAKLRRYWAWENFRDLGRFISALRASGKLLKHYHPNIVISAGSFVSVPLAWAAKTKKIPIIIHQEDIRPGLANKLIAPWANKVTVTFASSLKLFPGGKTVWTGNPVRSAVFQAQPQRARNLFNLPLDKPLILILGGGTGAEFINRLVDQFKDSLNQQVAIVHLTGLNRGQEARDLGDYHSRPFLGVELVDVMAASDVVVTRAGLGILTELSALKKPAIVIPIPSSHQEENAASLMASNAAVVLNQRSLTADKLQQNITELISHQAQRRILSDNIGQWNKPRAALAIVELIEQQLNL